MDMHIYIYVYIYIYMYIYIYIYQFKKFRFVFKKLPTHISNESIYTDISSESDRKCQANYNVKHTQFIKFHVRKFSKS